MPKQNKSLLLFLTAWLLALSLAAHAAPAVQTGKPYDTTGRPVDPVFTICVLTDGSTCPAALDSNGNLKGTLYDAADVAVTYPNPANVAPDSVVDAVAHTDSVTSCGSPPCVGYTTSMVGYHSAAFETSANASGNGYLVEGSVDGTTFVGLPMIDQSTHSVVLGGNTTTSASPRTWTVTCDCTQIRWKVSTYVSGTTTITTALKRYPIPDAGIGTVQGSVASGTADSNNPVKIGGVYTTGPTAVTTGKRVDQWSDQFGNFGKSPQCGGCVQETAASGNVAAATATATLAAASGKTTFITGFQITSDGATVGVCVNPTIAGTITGTLTYTYCAPAGALLAATPLIVTFTSPVPASTTNTTIVVSLPSLGTGSTNATVVATGFQQ